MGSNGKVWERKRQNGKGPGFARRLGVDVKDRIPGASTPEVLRMAHDDVLRVLGSREVP